MRRGLCVVVHGSFHDVVQINEIMHDVATAIVTDHFTP